MKPRVLSLECLPFASADLSFAELHNEKDSSRLQACASQPRRIGKKGTKNGSESRARSEQASPGSLRIRRGFHPRSARVPSDRQQLSNLLLAVAWSSSSDCKSCRGFSVRHFFV